MSLLSAVKTHYPLFGVHGLLLLAKARLTRTLVEAQVLVPGVEHPVHLRFRTSDVSVFRQVLVIAEYDWEISKTPRVIIDAGANIGLTSVFYANKYPQATIVAIEPEPSNYRMLIKNTAPYSNVIPIHAALWKHNLHLSLVDPGLGHFGFQTLASGSDLNGRNRLADVPSVTVDSLMKDLGVEWVDILKVDIEGAEKEVFADSATWIDRVGVLAVEMHDRLRVGCSRSVYLAAKDFEVESRKGETTFLVKRDYLVEGAWESLELGYASNTCSNQTGNKLPFKICAAG